MACSASPWFWARRNCWAVIVDGQRHVLGEHPDDSPPRKRKGKWVVPPSIQQTYFGLMASPDDPPKPSAPAVLTVAAVFERFLAWCQLNRSERTYEWSRNHIQCFCDHLKAQAPPAKMPVSDLAPIHVTEWVDANRKKRPGRRAWGPNHCRGAITAVVRAFPWAYKQRLVPENQRRAHGPELAETHDRLRHALPFHRRGHHHHRPDQRLLQLIPVLLLASC